jgi:hypothetical protein
MVALTGTALSAAAGLNAYIPILVVALLDRFTSVVTLPDPWSWLSSWWAIGAGAVLLASDVVLDKIPAVDSFNDAVQTAVRPASAGVVVAAMQAAQDLERSTWMSEHPWVPVAAGVGVALLVHTTKAVARPVINTATFGIGGPVVSTGEDGFSIVLAVSAVLVPVLALVLLLALVGVAVWVWSRRRSLRARPVE